MKTPTEKLVAALHALANDIQSEDGVANAAIQEAALRLTEQSEKLKGLRNGILQNNLEIEQTCGKALGYPWFKDDQKNFPGATEKDGVCVGEHVAATIASELAQRYTEALARIKRLEEAGDFMAKYLTNGPYSPNLMHQQGERDLRVSVWNQAKEAKP